MVVSYQDSIKVSLITPVYGVEKYIEKCAESLFLQTYRNCEFIFVNDCTPDESISVLKKVINRFPHRKEQIKIVTHDNNEGLACARNTGVDVALGDYVMHVDSDDTIDIRTVELCVKKVLEENADAVIVGMNHLLKKGNHIEHVSVPPDHTQYIKRLITRKAMVCMCGGLYRRSLYTDNNVWAVPHLNMGEDYSTKPRLLYNAKKVVALDMPLYNYNHLNETSYTRVFKSSRIDDLQKALSVLREFFCDSGVISEYENSLSEAECSSKIILLKSWAISQSTRQDFQRIRAMYDNTDAGLRLSGIDRLLLYLTQSDHPQLVRLIVHVGIKIKSLFK